MLDRRLFLGSTTAMIAASRMARATDAGNTANMSQASAYAFTFNPLDGGATILLAEHSGRPILVVNTASLCGYTPQYAGLQDLWKRYRARGLFMIGVPSNDFGGQEPGGAREIAQTAHDDYHVTFPLTEKAKVLGLNAHPFYRWAARERPGDVPRWNFHKYLVGRTGALTGAFASSTEPSDPRIVAAIEAELGA